jgi:hypothetical protein
MSTDLVPTVESEVIEGVPLSEAQAKTLNGRIHSACANFVYSRNELQDLLEQAYSGAIDAALGYPSWPAWFADNVSITPADKAERQAWASAMAGRGMSQRAIAGVLGVGVATVNADVAGVRNRTPDTASDSDNVVGLDGKRYRRKREPKQRKHDISPEAMEREIGDSAARMADEFADMFAGLAEDFDERIGDALCRLIESIAANLTVAQRERIKAAVLPRVEDE